MRKERGAGLSVHFFAVLLSVDTSFLLDQSPAGMLYIQPFSPFIPITARQIETDLSIEDPIQFQDAVLCKRSLPFQREV